MIGVYYTYLSASCQARFFDLHLPTFPKAFQDRVRRFKRWQDAQATLLGRILLERGIKEEYGIDQVSDRISYNGFQKPYLVDTEIDFNISHSEEIVICVIAPRKCIGIDIEKIRVIETTDFKSQMSENEWAKVTKSKDRYAAFFSYWTQKEAVIKACGKGLNVPLLSFEILDGRSFVENQYWYIREVEIDENFTCHLAANYYLSGEEIYLSKQSF
jgi:4'-phosphopantetheinyl transferase